MFGNANNNIGKNSIGKLMKKLAKICGVKNFEAVTGHSLRTCVINTMKKQGVSALEIAAHVGHSSLNAQMSYDRPLAQSIGNRALALRVGGPSVQEARATASPSVSTARGSSVAAPDTPRTVAAPEPPSSSSVEKLRLENQRLQLQIELEKAKAANNNVVSQANSVAPAPPAAAAPPSWPQQPSTYHHQQQFFPPPYWGYPPYYPPPPLGPYGAYPPAPTPNTAPATQPGYQGQPQGGYPPANNG